MAKNSRKLTSDAVTPPTSNTPAPAPAPDIETQAESATAVAEHEGAASPAPLARIGPADALPPATLPKVDPVAAASAKLKAERQDAAAELSRLARAIAEGGELTEDQSTRAATLIEAAHWTMGQWKAELMLQQSRATHRQAMKQHAVWSKEAAAAKQRLDEALAERARVLAEIDERINAHRNTIADAEAKVRDAEHARKALIASSPATLREKHTKASAAAVSIAETVQALERRAANDLVGLNKAKASRENTVEESDARISADRLLEKAQETYDQTMQELTDARTRLAEVQADAAELLHLCEVS